MRPKELFEFLEKDFLTEAIEEKSSQKIQGSAVAEVVKRNELHTFLPLSQKMGR